MRSQGLTVQMRKFADAYVLTGKKRQSAIDAGYEELGAHQIAWRLLRKPIVKKYISEKLGLIAAKMNLDVENLLEDAEEIKVRCMQGEEVCDREGRPTGEWKFDSQGALGAIDKQARMLGLYKDKLEVSVDEELATALKKARERATTRKP